MRFSWRWNDGTIFLNLKVIWEMSGKISELFRRAAAHAILAAVVSFLLLAPDFFIWHFVLKSPPLFSEKYFAIFSLFALILLLVKSNRVILLFLLFLTILQVAQFMNLAFFKDYLSPLGISLMWIEAADILEVVGHEAGRSFYGPAVVVICFVLIYLVAAKTKHLRLSLPYAPLLVILFLGFVPARILVMHDPIRFFPAAANPSLMNTLNTFALYAAVLLPNEAFATKATTPRYRPYRVIERQPIAAGTIVVIMGEGISYQRMGLFGHTRATTPRLSNLAQSGRLIAKKAISSGVSTRATLPLFFNVLREPLNREAVGTQVTNLFRLAKVRGYRTSYISAQKSNLLAGIGLRYIDNLVTKDLYEPLFREKLDDAIFDFLKDLELSQPNFVVIHQRALHGPYEYAYAKHPEFEFYEHRKLPHDERMRNTYDNGMHYYDWFIDHILDYLTARASKPLYVFITSDHSQEMGEEGRFGHSHLTLNSAKVPFMLYTVDPDPDFIQMINALQTPTHYEIGRSIATLLGFEIVNSNEVPGIFYINGPRAFGIAGVMTIEKMGAAQPRIINAICMQASFFRRQYC